MLPEEDSYGWQFNDCVKKWARINIKDESIPTQTEPSTGSEEETAIEILIELCKLKHYKDTVGKDSLYEKRQPELWKRANDFLNNHYSPSHNKQNVT
jgi:hypothetical protein